MVFLYFAGWFKTCNPPTSASRVVALQECTAKVLLQKCFESEMAWLTDNHMEQSQLWSKQIRNRCWCQMSQKRSSPEGLILSLIIWNMQKFNILDWSYRWLQAILFRHSRKVIYRSIGNLVHEVSTVHLPFLLNVFSLCKTYKWSSLLLIVHLISSNVFITRCRRCL